MDFFRGTRANKRFPAWPAALVLLAIAAAAPSWLLAADKAPPGVSGGSVKEVTVSRTPYYTNIEARFEGKIENYNSFKLNDPFRIVVDVWGASRGAAASEIAVDTPQVKTVKLAQQENKLRILVETPEDRPLPFLVTSEGGKIVVSVGGGQEEKVTSMERMEEGKPPAKGPAVVGIDLEDLPDVSNVVVTVAGESGHEVRKKAGSVTLFFPGASAEKGLLRLIDARKLGVPVTRILPAAEKKGVGVAISYAPGSTYTVEKRGDAVVVSFPKKASGEAQSAIVARASEGNETMPAGTAAAGGIEKGNGPAEGVAQYGFLSGGGGGAARKYVGQRISMDFKDADLQNVFRIIAEVSNFNIITSDDVRGKVTLRLINVPWDQALDLVLQSKALGAKQEGNVIRIAPLATLRTEERNRLDTQKEVEKLKATLEAVTETIPVSYTKAADLQPKIKDLLSEGGKIQVDERTNTLVIRDLAKNIAEAKSLIARLDTATPQVLIEARIVEVDTSFSTELGVQWGGSYAGTTGRTKVGVSGIQDSTGSTNAGLAVTNTESRPFSSSVPPASYSVNLPATIGLGAGGGISFGILRDNLRLDLSLSALEAANKGKVISSPKVITIDNKEALIEQGTQIPYSTVSASGTNTQFVDATLSLKVTPHITPDGGVIMKLEAKNDSQGEVGVTGQPAINKKKATTEVLVRDGETAVIGGILQITRKETEAGIPWLSKIPILGYLFKKDTNQATNRELLIFITPKILKAEPAPAKAS
ncbi:MAG: type IV pilus secretin PilQ [Deltaproteobacteria bacterium]|nr:type IV pilus secretin PilQ [Deltaproteobacteria bacterium]